MGWKDTWKTLVGEGDFSSETPIDNIDRIDRTPLTQGFVNIVNSVNDTSDSKSLQKSRESVNSKSGLSDEHPRMGFDSTKCSIPNPIDNIDAIDKTPSPPAFALDSVNTVNSVNGVSTLKTVGGDEELFRFLLQSIESAGPYLKLWPQVSGYLKRTLSPQQYRELESTYRNLAALPGAERLERARAAMSAEVKALYEGIAETMDRIEIEARRQGWAAKLWELEEEFTAAWDRSETPWGEVGALRHHVSAGRYQHRCADCFVVRACIREERRRWGFMCLHDCPSFAAKEKGR